MDTEKEKKEENKKAFIATLKQQYKSLMPMLSLFGYIKTHGEQVKPQNAPYSGSCSEEEAMSLIMEKYYKM